MFYCGANCAVLAGIFKTLLASDYDLPIPSWYPLDWKHNRQHYWIVYSYNAVGAFIVANVNVTMDCYAYYIMGMITAQFDMLYQQIERLGTNLDEVGKRVQEEVYETTLSYDMAMKSNVKLARLYLEEHESILE